MKHTLLIATMLLAGAVSAPAMGRVERVTDKPDLEIRALDLRGEIEGENLTCTLTFDAEVNRLDCRLPLVSGVVAEMASTLPPEARLERDGDAYVLVFKRRGAQKVSFSFAARPERDGDWRRAAFRVPEATVRTLAITGDRADLDVQFEGAINVERGPADGGRIAVSAYLSPGQPLRIQWKPQVRKLTGDLAVSCDAHAIAVARIGALQIDTLFTYRVVQGQLQRLSFAVPPAFNVTQVRGADLREWTIENATGGTRRLNVVLSRPHEGTYLLDVEGEQVLSAFPCAFDYPLLVPEGVMRASGFVMIGADSAIRLLVNQASGLTQIDQAAFPKANAPDLPRRAPPARSAYAYQYANLPFQMQLAADDIVTAFHAEERLVLSHGDSDLTLAADVELDIRDAPAREFAIETETGWTVAQVVGAPVADHDVRDTPTGRVVRVFFREAVTGRTVVSLRLERPLRDNPDRFDVPRFRVQGAKSERGHLVLRAETGVRLRIEKADGLREVHLASLPVRVADAQYAGRFKDSAWSLAVAVEREAPSISAETFHLVSLGEGGLFGSSSFTYLIRGAPVRTIQLRIPAACRNVEITGRDVRGWQQTGEVWTVTLQEKVLGDYTLLVTYDQPVAWEGAELAVGGVRTEGPVTESGYIAIAGSAGLAFDAETKRDPSVLPIADVELPREYALLINNPVLRAYKYIQSPHEAVVKIRRYPTQALLGDVADHMLLRTRLSREGEAVTEAVYFVKNTSRQYLGLRLPAGAKLWSASVDGRPVQAFGQEGGSVLLPLERRPNPDEPSRVQVVYAEEHGKLGPGRAVRLAAPKSDARSVFAKWDFALPDRFRVVRSAGNMMAPPPPPTGLAMLGPELLQRWVELWREGGGWIALWIIAAFAGAVLAFNAGRRRFAKSVTTWLAIGAAVAALVIAVAGGEWGPDWTWRGGWGDLRAWSLTKPVTLTDSELEASLTVVRDGVYYAVAAGITVVAFALAAFAWRRGRRRGWPVAAAAVALTAVTWALASQPVLLPALASALAALLPLAPLVGLVRALHRAGRRRAPARAEDEAPAASFADRIPPPAIEPPPAPAGGEAGFATTGLLMVAAAAGLAMLGAAGIAGADAPAPAQTNPPPAAVTNVPPPPPPPPPPPAFTMAGLKIVAPDVTQRDVPLNARATLTLTVETERPADYLLLPAAARVLTEFTSDSPQARLQAEGNGYRLKLAQKGKYSVTLQYLLPVAEREGRWQIQAWMPTNLRNEVHLELPAPNCEVESPQAVYLRTDEKEKGSDTMLVAGAAGDLAIAWRPRERETKREQTVFFCEVATLALFQPGLVGLTHQVRYQIAQGEIQSMQLRMPRGVSVTAVRGAGLSTWRFDPDAGQVEAWLEKPVSGEYVLVVAAQLARDKLPYEVEITGPEAVGASRQRGAVALAAGGEVQIHPGEAAGCSTMNTADFPAEAVKEALGAPQARGPAPAEVKRALRYHQLPASVKAQAERVLPEIRVLEESSVDVSDERMVLSGRLKLDFAKAGVFSVRLDLPDGFDVDSLTGDDVSHWDEVRDGGRGVQVNFVKQALGARTLNVVLSRMERRVDAEFDVPRIGVRDALKHTGTLAVSGERGLRFSAVKREGAGEINPRELGIQQAGYLAFRILRPDWAVRLKTEAMEPVVKVESVQRVSLSEGMMQGRVHLCYGIEHAGVKLFRLQSPRAGVALNVTGRNIARVQEVDPTNGVWEVELHGKAENEVAFEVAYQEPYDPAAKETVIHPLRARGVESQKGWLAVLAGGRLQVKPLDPPLELRPEDPRGIPAQLGAGDLSGALLCYRSAQPEWALQLSVVRHDAADVLAARVRSARLLSVVSDDDQRVTRALLDLEPGSLRFLEMRLPPQGELWSVFVDNRPVRPLVEKGRYLIPIEAPGAQRVAVECIYGERGMAGGAARAYAGPSFNLPLADIEWSLFLPPGYRYHGFGGTLNRREDQGGEVVTFTAERYQELNKKIIDASVVNAAQKLELGNQFWQQGRQEEARRAFEEAVAGSQAKADLNEDARIQFRSLVRQQAIVGLANRRNALKQARNESDEQVQQQVAGYNAGNWNAEYGKLVEQSLGAKESDMLGRVAERMLEQQSAAGAPPRPIRVTMPVQGQRFVFYRDLQVQPGAEMRITLKAGAEQWWRGALGVIAVLGTLLVYGAAWAMLRGRKPAAA